jgi:hypothetical protein
VPSLRREILALQPAPSLWRYTPRKPDRPRDAASCRCSDCVMLDVDCFGGCWCRRGPCGRRQFCCEQSRGVAQGVRTCRRCHLQHRRYAPSAQRAISAPSTDGRPRATRTSRSPWSAPPMHARRRRIARENDANVCSVCPRASGLFSGLFVPLGAVPCPFVHLLRTAGNLSTADKSRFHRHFRAVWSGCQNYVRQWPVLTV